MSRARSGALWDERDYRVLAEMLRRGADPEQVCAVLERGFVAVESKARDLLRGQRDVDDTTDPIEGLRRVLMTAPWKGLVYDHYQENGISTLWTDEMYDFAFDHYARGEGYSETVAALHETYPEQFYPDLRAMLSLVYRGVLSQEEFSAWSGVDQDAL